MSSEPQRPAPPARGRQARDLTSDIDAVLALSEGRSSGIPLSELEEMLRGRGAGLLILVLSMPFVVPVPIPFLAAVCGAPMMALGLRMALFRKSRLPQFARKAELSPEALRAVFHVMGFEDSRINENFGHMLTALGHGAPPHGGIAWGWDRFVTLLQDEPNIREVIPFPKTGDARDLMMRSPADLAAKQLRELHLKVEK